jgi:hypothetical protein
MSFTSHKYGIVVGFLSIKMTGIREVRFMNQTILTKSVCNGFNNYNFLES